MTNFYFKFGDKIFSISFNLLEKYLLTDSDTVEIPEIGQLVKHSLEEIRLSGNSYYELIDAGTDDERYYVIVSDMYELEGMIELSDFNESVEIDEKNYIEYGDEVELAVVKITFNSGCSVLHVNDYQLAKTCAGSHYGFKEYWVDNINELVHNFDLIASPTAYLHPSNVSIMTGSSVYGGYVSNLVQDIVVDKSVVWIHVKYTQKGFETLNVGLPIIKSTRFIPFNITSESDVKRIPQIIFSNTIISTDNLQVNEFTPHQCMYVPFSIKTNRVRKI